MSDEITPALSAEEWANVRSGERGCSVERGGWAIYSTLLRDGKWVRFGGGDEDGEIDVDAICAPMVIALANAAFPNEDPRKITLADVEHLRYMGQREISADEVGEMGAHAEYGQELMNLAAKLAAYLPPRSTPA